MDEERTPHDETPASVPDVPHEAAAEPGAGTAASSGPPPAAETDRPIYAPGPLPDRAPAVDEVAAPVGGAPPDEPAPLPADELPADDGGGSGDRRLLLVALAIVVGLAILAALYWSRREPAEPSAPPTEAMATTESLPTEPVGVASPELVGPVWKLVELVGADGAVTAVDDPSAYTLELRADGNVSALADCNTGMGTYTADATRISLQVAFTRAACPPGSLFDRYSAALAAAETYAIDDRGLAIRAPGADAMLFTKRDAEPTSVPAAPPTAVISIPNEATVGQLVTFDAMGSQSEAPLIAFAWSFGDGGRASGAKVAYAYDLAGTYLVELAVVDSNRQMGTSTASIKVLPPAKQPPTASVTGPATAKVGEEVTFDASSSNAGTSPIATYSWDLGNGETRPPGSVVKISTSYGQAGTYDVVVTVTDELGLSDSASTRIVVEAAAQPTPAPPVAVIRAPSQTTVGQLVTFDGSASSGAQPLVGYLWDFGDGSKANAMTIAHAYAAQGEYVVSLTVVDSLGARGSASARISVGASTKAPPTAMIVGPDETTAGDEVTLDASGSRAGSSPIVSYAWTLGDASSTRLGAGPTLTGRPARPGVNQVYVTVTDESGLSGSASHQLVVNAPLVGVVWQLATSLPSAPVTLGFVDSALGGSTGCNTYSGTFTATPDGQLTTSGISVTRATCGDDVVAQETSYLAALESAQSYSITADKLSITHAAGVLEFAARGAIPSE